MKKEKEFTEKSSLATTSNPVRKCSDSIPVDLLIDIFSRVPSKSIARFRCVSKLWSYVLDRPDFTELFLSKSWTRPLLFFSLKTNGKLFFYSSPQPQSINKDTCLVATRYPMDFQTYRSMDFQSLVNGFALLYQGFEGAICNPATGKFLTLPKVEGESIRDLYLGYDPINKQFKVLCMTTYFEEPDDTHMVLTVEETGTWRSIDYKFHFAWDHRTNGSNICINGVLYFGAELEDGFKVIVSFDVRSEKFVFISNVEEEMFGNCMTLFNFQGKLAIFDSIGLWSYVVWVLEDGGNHKWSKHVFELPYRSIDRRFVGVTVTGDLLWSSDRDSNPFYLHFYNLESKKFTM